MFVAKQKYFSNLSIFNQFYTDNQQPGSVIAIMGPSGSGKTTLLNILAHRNTGVDVTGEMLINSKNAAALFSKNGAFVSQDDVLYGDLTVRETLEFAAFLRMPSSKYSRKEKLARVDEVLSMLRLTEVQHSRIGGILHRGISGGEKRRVSIGIEILTSPGILLADEITSGLDSYSAMCVMDVLAFMAKGGATIITTIHQPSSQLYQRFDELLLLAKGKLIYYGKANSAVEYFERMNYSTPVGYNPADYFLELVSEKENVDKLAKAFKHSPEQSELKAKLAQVHGNSKTYKRKKPQKSNEFCREYANNWVYQLLVLSLRNLLRLVKNPMFIGQMFISYAFSALMMGALFSNLQSNAENQLTLCIAFMLDVFGINAFFAVSTFIQDSAVYRREHSSGYYSSSSYFISRVGCAMPFNFAICTVYTLLLFYLVDLTGQDYAKLFPLLMLNYLTMETFIAMNEIFGTLFSRLEVAILVAGIFNTLQMLFNGVFINYPNIPSYLQWVYWCSFMTYSLSGIMLLQYNDTPSGIQWLELYGIQVQEVNTCIYILVAFLIFFRFMSYICLRFFGDKN